MDLWNTIIPLAFAESISHCSFGEGITLTRIPDWLKQDQIFTLWVEKGVPGRTGDNAMCILFEYRAHSLGMSDPDSPRKRPIQETRTDLAFLVNLAFWLLRPSPLSFSRVLHAPRTESGPFVQSVQEMSPFLCHPDNEHDRVQDGDLPRIEQIFGSLRQIPEDGPIWTAIRATIAALQTNLEPLRHLELWIGLEALFGPDDSREMSFRLRQRIAFFLANCRSEAKETEKRVKESYNFRSSVAHGRWKESEGATALVGETESLVRHSLQRILLKPTLIETFQTKRREEFLDDLVFKP